ncbi:flagellar basal body P-ring formation chaperone FlgA [Thiosulfativibrio zosterae]|uniref:Flagella basal body P-ring formation protein FlgA n=1 Tax=Thiosulfativibrio zosterae TaxID=2675053 RepID=A0A6F8PLR8_9GAMM|nr:flagellar basal body P-ring formation chaperone FlgA [Thiosulfativibrio zosterae]BBP43061.1 hypothetical protein THMIRHAT_08070 [Thiosulfativibrio zosterae]
MSFWRTPLQTLWSAPKRLKHSQKQPGLVIFGLFLSIFFTQTAHSAEENTPLQSPESLYQLVLEHLKQKTDQQLFNVKIEIQTLSKHLRFQQCTTTPDLLDKNPTDIAGRNTFKVSCENPDWSIYMTAKVEGDLPVIMSTQGILKSAVIKKDDIATVLVPYQKVKRGAFTQLQKVLGYRAKKNISPNTIITLKDVLPPYWVFKDKPVNLVTHIGDINIETKGVALSDAVEQEQVTVKNLSSQKRVKGIVIAPNTVWIP